MGKNLSLTSSAFNASGKFGASLSAGYGIAANVLASGTKISMAGWVKASSNGAAACAFGQGGVLWAGMDGVGYALGRYGDSTDVQVASTVMIADGAWHYLEFCADSSGAAYLFVDGVLAGSSNTQTTFNFSSSGGRFGVRILPFGSSASGLAWPGEVDDVAVFSGLRHTSSYAAPTTPTSNTAPNLLAAYHLDGDGADAAGVTTAPTMTSLYSSTFDSDSVGAMPGGWTAKVGSWAVGSISPISGSQSFGSTSNADGDVALYTAAGARGNMRVTSSCKLTGAPRTATNNYYVALRMDSAYQNGYLLATETTAAENRVRLYKRTAGAFAVTQEAFFDFAGWAAGDVMMSEATITGNLIEFRVWKSTGSRPAAASLWFTDDSFATGYPGLYRAGVSQAASAVDNFLLETPVDAVAPGAPTIGTATAGNGAASVTFAAPSSDGGSAVTSYLVTASTGETATGGSSPIAISLSNGVARTLHVQAINSVGPGPASAESNSITPQAAADTTLPTMNGSLAVSAPTADGFTLTWPAASDNVGVAGYELDDGSGSYSSVGNVLTKVVAGKTASTAYSIKVRAFDAAGNRAVTPLAATATTAAGPVTIVVTDANLYFSPFNWYSDGAGAMQANNVKASSSYAWCNMRGGYLKFKASVGTSGSIALSLNTAMLSSIAAAGCPQIAWSISAGAIQSRTLAAGDASLSLATGLAAGTYDVFVWFRGVYITQDGGQAQNYTTPNNRFQVTSVVLSAGGSLSAPTVRSKKMIAYGDSITEGDLSNGGPRSATSQDASLTYGWLLAEALDAEVGIVGFYGMTWSWFDSTWANYAQGLSRLANGRLSPAPDFVTVNYGENDGNPGPAASTVTTTLSAISAAAPSAKIVNLIPFSGRARTNLISATLPANGYRIDLAPPEMANGALVWSYDGQHPNQRGHANLASLLAAKVNAMQLNTAARTFSIQLGINSTTPAANLTGLKIRCYNADGSLAYSTDAGSSDANGYVTVAAQSTAAAGALCQMTVNGSGRNHSAFVQVT